MAKSANTRFLRCCLMHMTVGGSSEYLKIIVKIMKKNKILIKALSVIFVISFISVFCLGIILPVVNRSSDYYSLVAYAAEDNNYWEEYKGQSTSFKANSYVFNDELIYEERWNTRFDSYDWRIITFNFISNGNFCNYIYCRFVENEEIVLGYSVYYPSDGEFRETDLYSSSGGWDNYDWQDITFSKGDFPSVLQYFLISFAKIDTNSGAYNDGYIAGEEDGYNKGHDEGLTEGYYNGYIAGEEDGYNKGHSEGFNLGQSQQLKNPVDLFLRPASDFLNIKFFGVVSLGSILSIVLFVSFAIIFIKMFAGG